MSSFFDFFFQAEDGIRDGHVTGVQTCALPISARTPTAATTTFGACVSQEHSGPSMGADVVDPPGIFRWSLPYGWSYRSFGAERHERGGKLWFRYAAADGRSTIVDHDEYAATGHGVFISTFPLF